HLPSGHRRLDVPRFDEGIFRRALDGHADRVVHCTSLPSSLVIFCRQSLMPVNVMPSMKYLCAMKNSTSTGSAISVDITIRQFHCGASFTPPMTKYMPTFIVYFFMSVR